MAEVEKLYTGCGNEPFKCIELHMHRRNLAKHFLNLRKWRRMWVPGLLHQLRIIHVQRINRGCVAVQISLSSFSEQRTNFEASALSKRISTVSLRDVYSPLKAVTFRLSLTTRVN